jgi:8-oxo-dGTP pyrophosphatase MutT (NUDIX family)
MDDWQKGFWELFEGTTEAIEQFVEEVTSVVEDLAEQVTVEIASDIEQFFQDFQTFLESAIALEDDSTLRDRIETLSTYLDDEDAFFQESLEEIGLSLNPKIDPSTRIHRACIGCRHYHGRVYRGNLLVCGMHPYGWEDDNCPDWENLQ